MGKTVEKIATQRGHTISYILKGGSFNTDELKDVDVAIEFTQPDAARENIMNLLELRIPVVSGTTGWLEHKGDADAAAQANQVGFLYASNFSLGVNLFFVMNERLARLMSDHTEYVPKSSKRKGTPLGLLVQQRRHHLYVQAIL